ncbi:MAG: selenide, water dikinase SelD [Planctomycetales bacterium]|nr:selenide, water dikinase SelD [Planctomycetales bacterium]
MQTSLPQHEIVLLGVGHTNAHVLRMWRMNPIPGARLTCVSNFPIATYSGMLPGTLAGLYAPRQMEIDLVRLTSAAGARLIEAEVVGIDHEKNCLRLRDRPELPFDVLSIGIGSVPKLDIPQSPAAPVMAIKPMQTFLQRLDSHLAAWSQQHPGAPLQIVVAGGGPAGCEIACALPKRIQQTLKNHTLGIRVVDAHQTICRGMTQKAQHKLAEIFAARGIETTLGSAITRFDDEHVALADGQTLPADLVLLATSAAAPPLLGQLELPLDDRGFLLTDATLATKGNQAVFAVGDSGSIEGAALPKAGVYAVREGPVLWNNIQHHLRGEPLERYEPQSSFLKLLSTGDGRALLEYKGFVFHNAWCFALKDRIDTRFMAMYQDYAPMTMDAAHTQSPTPNTTMPSHRIRCAGCGGKLGGSILSKVLSRLNVPTNDTVVLGLEAPDDAAIVRIANGNTVAATIDFFTPPLDDYYLSGRIAAINAASDLFAIGAQPTAALAACIVPPGPARRQEQLLYELLCGAVEEFRAMNVALVGGHTTEGPEASIGFTLLGQPGPNEGRTKRGLRLGDRLVLTKPLGVGSLLVARMQAQCRAEWIQPLMRHLLTSNESAAAAALAGDISAMTDITGFGLAGHLLEMLDGSGCSAELRLGAIPLLPGADETLEHGIESTLAPDNRLAETRIDVAKHDAEMPQYAALFDPQTCGGLLIGVAEEHHQPLLAALRQVGVAAATIGKTMACDENGVRIRLC